MELRLQRLLGDTAKLDRMQIRESQKDERERQLVMIKNKAMPTLHPTLRRPKDEKCGKCNADKKVFIKYEDWFLEPIDVLTMAIESKGWTEWTKIELSRKLLSRSMDALVIHPAQIKMLKNLENASVPVIFVMKSEKFGLNVEIVKLVLSLNSLSAKIIEKSQEKENIIKEVNKGENVIVEMESFEKLVVKKKNYDDFDNFYVPAYKTPEKTIDEESSKKLSTDQKTQKKLQADENSEKLPDEEISEKLSIDQKIQEKLQADENSKKLPDEEMSEKLSIDQKTQEKLQADENFKEIINTKSLQEPLTEKTPEKLVKASKNILNVKSPEKLDTKESCEKTFPLTQESQKLPQNVHFVPVTINYEKLSEENELNWRTKNDLGIVKINFHEPYMFNDVLQTNDAVDINAKLKAIEDHLKYDLTMKRPVMSTNVVAFLLLTNFRKGTLYSFFATKFNDLCNEKCNIDFGFEGESSDVVEHAIKILGDLVEVKDGKISPKNFIELSRYAEVLTPHYALESILAIAAMGLKSKEGHIEFNSLLQAGADLCDLLVIDIPLKKPCQDFTSRLDLEFDKAVLRRLMYKSESQPISESAKRALKLSRRLDDLSEGDWACQRFYRHRDNKVRMFYAESGTVDYFKSITMPILEAYLTVACCLRTLWTTEGTKISVEKFLESSMKAMREECEDKNCVYWESCSERWMRNGLKLFSQKHTIEIDDNQIIISPDYIVKQNIYSIIRSIERFFDFSGK